jgi:hypothetical protein
MGNINNKNNMHDIKLPVPDEAQKFIIIKTIESCIEPLETDIDATNNTIYKRWGQHNVKGDPKRETILRIVITENPDGAVIKREIAFDRWANRKTATYY